VDAPQLLPLADQAVMAYCESEADALVLAAAVRRLKPSWLVDVVPAYTSVAIFFDQEKTDSHAVASEVEQIVHSRQALPVPQGRLHRIPCCYELGLDLERVSAHAGLPVDEVIRLHTASAYTVYAIGFCPGFPFLGYLPEALSGVPRLLSPRLQVEAGSVGLTGRQTGIYTEARPGGWNILGRTPLELVHVANGYFPIHIGDRIQFHRIDDREFRRLSGQRLRTDGEN
jgi:inhibitor of KinA